MMGYHRWHEFPQDFRASFLGALPLNTPLWKKSALGVRASPNKVILGFKALRQAKAPVAEFKPTTEGSLQIQGRVNIYSDCTINREGVMCPKPALVISEKGA
ncbi:hypothetical protein PoB_002184600 [Plakobranchus ocellatus]|uniref:Uncharacterized protein n=1 Tax=Plakobranchus ocellatus TaxID=259542 RepID=A0AAV3ZHG6_9GAST|nr:hypothetical protein PoB_002184600 [Plakobranchus ocellatus]